MNKNPSIAVIGTRGPCTAGGIETVCQELYPLLVDDFDITIYTRAPYLDPKQTDFKGIHLKHIPAPNHKQLEAFIHSFLATLAAMTSSADILHFHAQGPTLFSILPRLFTPWKKVVYTCHGLDRQRAKWGLLAKTILTMGEWASAHCTHRRTSVSQAIANYYQATYNKPTQAIANGTPLWDAVPAGETLARLGLEAKKYWIYLGRLVPEKGIHDLIEAYQQLSQDERKGVKLCIAGPVIEGDAYCDKLQAMAANDSDIVFAGFVKGEALRELYTNAFAAATASHLEGFSVSLLEALGSRLPVVLTDIEAHLDVQVLSGEQDTPFLHYFAVTNASAMADRFREVLALSPERYEDLSGQAQAFVRRHFTWQPIAQQYKTFYEQALAGDAPVSATPSTVS